MDAGAVQDTVAEHAQMTLTEVEKIAYDLKHPYQKAASAVTDAATATAIIEDDLRRKINWGRRDLERALNDLAAGHYISELGILQNTSLQIDILAARRAAAYTRLKAACRTLATLPPPPIPTSTTQDT